jgi:hypothetical protein
MSDIANESPIQSPRRFRFSIGTLLLWIAIAALTANTIITNRKLARLNMELSSYQPLPPKEVARQFAKSTTHGPITTSVTDVRYSPDNDEYKVQFSWVDATNGKTWSSDTRLKHDGFGVYYGEIRNGPFIQPLGFKELFPVSVRTPSAFSE